MRHVSLTDVAKILNVSRCTVYKLIATDLRFPSPAQIGKVLRFNYQEILDYIQRTREDYEKKHGRFL